MHRGECEVANISSKDSDGSEWERAKVSPTIALYLCRTLRRSKSGASQLESTTSNGDELSMDEQIFPTDMFELRLRHARLLRPASPSSSFRNVPEGGAVSGISESAWCA
eukprot:3932951-Rhodomonas_salina.2